MNKLYTIILLLFFANLINAQNKNNQFSLEVTNFFDQKKTFLKEHNCGVQIAYQNGNKKFIKSFGSSNQEEPIKENSKFNIGSLSKLFTSVLIGQAVDQGLLSLDDTISKFLPNYSLQLNQATVRQLLLHKSGISEVLIDSITNIAFLNRNDENNFESILKHLKNPREDINEFRYCNTNYIILSLVLEEIYGMDYADILREKLLCPLEINNTFAYPKSEDTTIAHPHHGGANLRKYIYYRHYKTLLSGAGSIFSTAHDLLTFTNALISDSLVSSDYFSKMLPDCNSDYYGLGLLCYGIRDNELFYGHNGYYIGYQTMLTFNPLTKEIIIILINSSDHDVAEEIFTEFVDLILSL